MVKATRSEDGWPLFRCEQIWDLKAIKKNQKPDLEMNLLGAASGNQISAWLQMLNYFSLKVIDYFN